MKNQNYKDYLIFNGERYSENDKTQLADIFNKVNPKHASDQSKSDLMWAYLYIEDSDMIVADLVSTEIVTILNRRYLKTLEDIVNFINSEDCYIERYVDDTLCAVYKIEANHLAAWYRHHDGTGDLHGKLNIPTTYMQLRIDNYYISVNDNYMSICIDGQNIIHHRLKNKSYTRRDIASVAIDAINGYNWVNNYEWNHSK